MVSLKNKEVLFIGDSITEGVGASCREKCFVEVFSKLSGAKVYNYGISGTSVARQIDPVVSNFGDSFPERVDKMNETADYVIVFGGTNDFGHGDAPFGTFFDNDDKSFCGALNLLVSKLYSKYPNARIIFLTPLHRSSENLTINEIGLPCKPLKDYVKAEIQLCETYSIPVLDLWGKSNITPFVDASKKTYMPDGLHPSDLGHERIAKMLYTFILNLD